MTSASRTVVAGVDGCPGGWAVVTAGLEPGDPVRVELMARIAPLVRRVERGEVAMVAIDMPIGLPEVDRRRCDVEARRLLGRRGSSVFPAPLRCVLGSADHAEACRRSRVASSRALSIQAFNLLPKIAELDRDVPVAMGDVVVECHPELAFLRLAGAALDPKRSAVGRQQRLDLVAGVLGAACDLAASSRRAGVPLSDALDAAALVATARRLLAGEACLLGGELDPLGRPMRVAW